MKPVTILQRLATVLPLVAAYPAGQNQSEYEYIVVGSGTGGGTVAAGLARKGHSVFLIEAGADRGDTLPQMVPGLSTVASDDPEHAWSFWIRHYRNETQGRRDSKFTYRLPDGSLYYGLEPPPDAEPLGILYPRGATVGGSSQVNAQNWAKASDNDWDWVANYTSDPSWNAQAMEPYFIAVENCTYCEPGTPNHGFDGFISSNINNATYVTGRPYVVEYMSNAALEIENITIQNNEQLAELLNRDSNSPEHSYTPGIYEIITSSDERRRRSGSRNYVVDTVNAGFPLTVSTESLATRVLFNKNGGDVVAYGVEYMKGEALYAADSRYDATQSGELRTVVASKEVIVAGGVFNTPQLLKLSGVGPREELENLGIEVVVDSPAVGSYLQDHPEGIIRVNASVPFGNDPFENCTMQLNASDPCFVQWQDEGMGPYGEGAAPLHMRFRSSESENEDSDVWMWGFAGLDFRGFYPGYAHPLPAPDTISMSMLKCQTPGDEAKGTVTLRSADPRDVPEVNFDWFNGEQGRKELNAMVEGAELLNRIFDRAAEPIAPFTPVQPAEGVDLRQNLLDETFSHHAGSTCRMGPGSVQTHCVDPQLRVNGVKGLRVVDASVFPRVISSFPNLPITMMAHKAVDIISAAAGNYSRAA
ncbi:unnamed protein product [Periconia digitata]|uniref:Choline dehydrogenase n=1 Tax=Periconia digitata TaxID=1303443 RepID=A0A9W4XU87_9PLEO|nr:unnamed protein product [Periconia digitata]